MPQNQENESLKAHRGALEALYSKFNFNQDPWGYSKSYLDWNRDKIHRPVYENLQQGNVLDAGGGYGYGRRYTQGRMHLSVDISLNILKHDSGQPKVIGAIEELPIKTGAFDNVVSVGVLRHCFNPERFIAEIHRVLTPEGRLVIATPAADWPAVLRGTFWDFFKIFYATSVYFGKKGEPSNEGASDGNGDSGKTQEDGNAKKGVVCDRLYLMDELISMIETRFRVVKSGRCGVNILSSKRINPPRFLVDRYFNQDRHGRFIYVVAQK
jgi:SAM-dependent methyltransferase